MPSTDPPRGPPWDTNEAYVAHMTDVLREQVHPPHFTSEEVDLAQSVLSKPSPLAVAVLVRLLHRKVEWFVWGKNTDRYVRVFLLAKKGKRTLLEDEDATQTSTPTDADNTTAADDIPPAELTSQSELTLKELLRLGFLEEASTTGLALAAASSPCVTNAQLKDALTAASPRGAKLPSGRTDLVAALGKAGNQRTLTGKRVNVGDHLRAAVKSAVVRPSPALRRLFHRAIMLHYAGTWMQWEVSLDSFSQQQVSLQNQTEESEAVDINALIHNSTHVAAGSCPALQALFRKLKFPCRDDASTLTRSAHKLFQSRAELLAYEGARDLTLAMEALLRSVGSLGSSSSSTSSASAASGGASGSGAAGLSATAKSNATATAVAASNLDDPDQWISDALKDLDVFALAEFADCSRKPFLAAVADLCKDALSHPGRVAMLSARLASKVSLGG